MTNIKKQTLLPGLKSQLRFLKKNLSTVPENILVIGSSSEWIASEFSRTLGNNVNLIVGDYESLLNAKLILGEESFVKTSLMDFEITDFDKETFDLVYAQASISLTNRNKIVKEIKQILKPGGYFCVGEIVSLKKDVPAFMGDIYDSSDLNPLFIDDLEKYYGERKFNIIAKQNLSETLKEYYLQCSSLLREKTEDLTDREKSYYKKLLNKVSHQSNVYLKLGGDKYMGLVALLLQKGEN